MASEWFYTLRGQQAQAPATAAQLKQLASSGQLTPADLVWQDGMPNWVPASSIKGLFAPAKAAEAPAADRVPAARPESPGRATARAGSPPDVAKSPPGVPDLHPALALLLTVCSCGLFGLWYAYQVCAAFDARATGRTADGAGRPLGRPRHPLGVLVLTYLTAGVYFYYWVYRVLRECGDYTGRRDADPRVELTLMLLFPLYGVYVAVFRLPGVIRHAQVQAGLPEHALLRESPLFLNPCFYFALPLLAMSYQEALNQVWGTAA
jgi:hypothetical protein